MIINTNIKKRFSLPLKLLLGSGLIALFILYFLFIFYYSLPQMKHALDTSNQNIIQEHIKTLEQNTRTLIEKAQTHTQLTSQLSKQLSIQNIANKDTEALFMNILDKNPSFSAIYIALLNGQFFMVQNHPQGYITKTIKHKKSHLIYKNKKRIVKDKKGLMNDTYDPRMRPWFKKAMQQKSGILSDIYLFYTKQSLGITSAYPMFKRGLIAGVIGIDIELKNLSSQTQKTLKESQIHSLIFDHNHFVIAAPSLEKPSSDALKKLPKIETLAPSPAKEAFLNYLKKPKQSFSYLYKKDLFSASVRPFTLIKNQPWYLVASISQNTFLEPIRNTYKQLVLATLLLFGLLFLYLAIISEKLSQSIEKLIKETIQIKSMNFDSKAIKASFIYEISQLQLAISIMKKGLKSFKKYVPKHVVKTILEKSEEANISSEKKTVTVLFSDIQTFSKLLEQSQASAITNQLSEYFENCSLEIAQFLGQVDKFVGDSIMAYWSNSDEKTDAILACSCTLSLLDKLEKLNKMWLKQNKLFFHTRFGLGTGEAIIGNIGSSHRLDYTLIGNCVNIANRLEAANKHFDTKILIGEPTFQLVKDDLICIPLDTVIFRNFKTPINLYTVLSQKNDDTNPDWLKQVKLFSDAISFYKEKEWEKAYEDFKKLAKPIHPLPSHLFLKRLEGLLKDKPKDWSYVIDYNIKTD